MHAFGATRSHQAEMRAEMVVCGGLWMDVAVGRVLHKSTTRWVGAAVSNSTMLGRLSNVHGHGSRLLVGGPSSGGGAASSSHGPRINPGAWSSALLPGRVLVGVVCRAAQPGHIRKGTNGTADVGTLGERDWAREQGRAAGHEKAVRGIAHRCRSVCQSSGCRRCEFWWCRLPSSGFEGLDSVGEEKVAVCQIGRGQFEHAPSAHDAKWSSKTGRNDASTLSADCGR